jgi:hypothetical protein
MREVDIFSVLVDRSLVSSGGFATGLPSGLVFQLNLEFRSL